MTALVKTHTGGNWTQYLFICFLKNGSSQWHGI